jgi:hypothetical protein
MFKNIHLKTLLIAVLAFLTSCEKDDTPDPINENEVFTKVELIVTNQSDNSSTTYTFEVDHDHDHSEDNHDDDADDDHGDHMEVELSSNSTYTFELRFWNESDPNNIENMTSDIIEEADEHQVFYELTDDSITITAAADDTKDSNNNPVHIKTIWETTTAGVVDVEAFLIHEPTSKTGTVRADFGGATDVEIDFEAHVE